MPSPMPKQQKTVFIAGSTGYLGRFLVDEYLRRDFKVLALLRQPIDDFPSEAVQLVAQATDATSLTSILDGYNVDLVVSSLGITRQRDGLTYRDVDFGANKNIMDLALAQKRVPDFCYVHVLGGEIIAEKSEMIRAKQDFVDLLESSSICSTVICPSGFFSDMKDFRDMAVQGRVYLFGDGQHRINPIHGKDLAFAIANFSGEKDVDDNVDAGGTKQNTHRRLDIGGPDILSHKQIAELAFECLDQEQPAKITFAPDWIRRFLIAVLPWVTPNHIHGPAEFGLTAADLDLVGDCHGTHHLKDFFSGLNMKDEEKPK